MKFKIIIIILCNMLAGQMMQAMISPTSYSNELPVSCDYNLPDTAGNEFIIKPFNIEIVPPSSGVQFFKDDIIFLSYSSDEENVPEEHISFGLIKIYMIQAGDTVPGIYKQFQIISPVIFPCEATTFSEDFQTMYLSLIPEKENKERIFRAINSPDGWMIDTNPLGFCVNNYIYTHPSLSSDGSFMIFSSDMSGSFGGLDLYITKKNGDGWSYPENMGKHINSVGNEIFACLDKDNNLFFSSDGLSGKGGYDIFVCLYNGKGWDKPQSIAGNINTAEDEVAFKINKTDSRTTYFTSRLRSEKNRTQLYQISLNPDYALAANSNLQSQLIGFKGDKTIDRISEPEPSPAITAYTEAKRVETPAVEKQTTKKTETVTQKIPLNTKDISQGESDVVQEKGGKSDIVVYRVQILANSKPTGSRIIKVAGKDYKSFEYLYKGAYRTTIGEFNTISDAVKFQNLCRHNGYSQAFVVAFKNNIRSTDPTLFK